MGIAMEARFNGGLLVTEKTSRLYAEIIRQRISKQTHLELLREIKKNEYDRAGYQGILDYAEEQPASLTPTQARRINNIIAELDWALAVYKKQVVTLGGKQS